MNGTVTSTKHACSGNVDVSTEPVDTMYVRIICHLFELNSIYKHTRCKYMDPKDVSIIGYESVDFPYDSSTINMLTQIIRKQDLSLSTYICIPNAAEVERDKDGGDLNHKDSLTVVNYNKYLKKILHNTSELKGIPSDLLIIVCHGDERDEKG